MDWCRPACGLQVHGLQAEVQHLRYNLFNFLDVLLRFSHDRFLYFAHMVRWSGYLVLGAAASRCFTCSIIALNRASPRNDLKSGSDSRSSACAKPLPTTSRNTERASADLWSVTSTHARLYKVLSVYL